MFVVFRYIVLWKKGYQQTQEPHGTSVIKVKGVARLNGNNSFFYTSNNTKKNLCHLKTNSIERILGGSTGYVWDTPEYEVPPLVRQ